MGLFGRKKQQDSAADSCCDQPPVSPLADVAPEAADDGSENGSADGALEVTVSDLAQEKLREIVREREVAGVRLNVQGPGSYTMNLVTEEDRTEDDRVLEYEGFQVFVDASYREFLHGAAIDFVEDMMGGGFRIDNPNTAPSVHPQAEPPTEGPDAEIWQKVQAVFESTINPAIASHGGFVHLIDVKDGRVYVELGGGCQGCGMANVTLRNGIERVIREEVPEVVEVLDVTDHGSGANPYYSASKK